MKKSQLDYRIMCRNILNWLFYTLFISSLPILIKYFISYIHHTQIDFYNQYLNDFIFLTFFISLITLKELNDIENEKGSTIFKTILNISLKIIAGLSLICLVILLLEDMKHINCDKTIIGTIMLYCFIIGCLVGMLNHYFSSLKNE